MKRKIMVSVAVCFFVGGSLAPPDMICQIALGIAAAVLCGVTLLALARRPFVKSSPSAMHTLVCVLVCTISVLSVACYQLNLKAFEQSKRAATSVSAAPSEKPAQ